MTLGNDRACVVTGAGRGIGRAQALELATHGYRVIVNDLISTSEGCTDDAAAEVVEEVRRQGGTAQVSHHDITNWDSAQELVEFSVSAFGQLDVVVNNAGILRDRMIVNMDESDWDDVLAVHAKGTFQVTRWASAHWRERQRSGHPVDARVINTTSASGLYGNPGQANYATAKAGIAAFTLVAARELARYGVTVNAIAPAAVTRMTKHLPITTQIGHDVLAPTWVSPLVAWLASSESADITGRVFEVSGQRLAVAQGWSTGPVAAPTKDAYAAGAAIRELLAQARPNADISGAIPDSVDPAAQDSR